VSAVPDDAGRNVISAIAAKLPYLRPALRQVGELVLAEPERAKGMTISELAAAAGVADSTVTRFVKELGLGGYQSLRVGIAESLMTERGESEEERQGRYVYEGITQLDSSASIVAKIAGGGMQALQRTGAGLDPQAVDRATDLIERANVLLFCCMGSSSIAGEEGVMRFVRAGKKCLLFRDQSLQLMSATIADPRDVLIGISVSGASTPVVEALEQGRENGAATIAVTATQDSEIVRHADVALYSTALPSEREGLYGESVTAKWGQLLVIDVLYATYAARHFDSSLEHLQRTYESGIRATRLRER